MANNIGCIRVRRAFMIDHNPFAKMKVRRVIVDKYGMAFIPGHAWTTPENGGYKLVYLPGFEIFDFEGCDNPHDQLWAWMYFNKPEKFFFCRKTVEEDGVYYSA